LLNRQPASNGIVARGDTWALTGKDSAISASHHTCDVR
jgi:hypothetical protein